MRKKKIVSIVLIIISIILMGVNAEAHSGRTDSNGGHKDNKNKSGLGSYHYHCGGYPAHLHPDGVCPYSSSSTSSSSSSNQKQTTTSTTVDVEEIKINEPIGSLEVGKSKILIVTITPSNATNKSITWKSSGESIATISTIGEITAKKSGAVDITATSSNGKTSTIRVNIKEEEKDENSIVMKTSTTNQDRTANNTVNSNQKESNPLAGFLAIGLLGGGGYWGYKKYKKS